jgi:AcrR family transcriptional regulator
MATMAADTTTRRQERGLKRIEEILDAADALFAEVGYEAASTNQIAARAGISPGSLYQFFSNKLAIAEALADRYLRLLNEEAGGVFEPAVAALPLDEMVDAVIDPLVAFNTAHPGVKTMMAESSPELIEASRHLHAAMCDRVEVLVEGCAPQLSRRDRDLVADVTVQVFSALLPDVIAATRRERPRLVRELKAVIAGYWRTLAERA